MKYCVVELKTAQDETFTVSTFKKDTLDEANRAYHSILANAAVSDGLYHAAVILDWRGKIVDNKSEYYKHEPEPEPEPEPEEQTEAEPKDEVEEEPKDGE